MSPRPPRTPKSYVPVDLRAAHRYPIRERRNLVEIEHFGRPVGPEASAAEFLDALPGFLGAASLRELARAIVSSRRAGRPVVFAMGAHVVKVGCGPLVVDLIERGVVTAVAVNGAFAIHDYEIALLGKTSEKVDETIRDGSFGWARETGEAFARAARRGAEGDCGLGRAVGLEVLGGGASDRDPPRGAVDAGDVTWTPLANARASVVGACARLGIPCGVHVALGTDTVHMHPDVSGADLGAASHVDFRLLAAVACDLEGGVWVNIGSAVVLPEVFLKLVSIARNLGHKLEDVTAGNLDMLNHYRTSANVIARPVKRGISILGHHEILIPLLRVAILAEMEKLA